MPRNKKLAIHNKRATRACRWLLAGLSDLPDHIARIDIEASADVHEVDDIQSALAQFVLGDERLCAVQLLSHLGLRKPSALASLYQQLA
jgi:hypothetical protein